MEARLDELKTLYHTRQGQLQQVESQIKALEETIYNGEQELLEYEHTRILLQKSADHAREKARKKLEDTVTSALQYVFGSDFQFCIELSESRGQPVAEFYAISKIGDTTIKAKPEDSTGGGLVDIISLALRIAVLQIHHDPHIKGPIVLDEPGKHVSEDYVIKLATFLRQISKYFERQIIMVTHQQHLAEIADKAFEVEIVGNGSRVTKYGGNKHV